MEWFWVVLYCEVCACVSVYVSMCIMDPDGPVFRGGGGTGSLWLLA